MADMNTGAAPAAAAPATESKVTEDTAAAEGVEDGAEAEAGPIR